MERVNDSHSNAGDALQPADYLRLLRTHIRWWAIPAVGCALVAGCVHVRRATRMEGDPGADHAA